MNHDRTRGPQRPLPQAKAIYYFVINQLATPGLGSFLGRRFIEAFGQLSLSITGFVLLLGWMYHYFHSKILLAIDEPVPVTPYNWLGEWGLILFGAAWIWSLFTSISMLRHVAPDPPAPPRICDVLPQNPIGPGR